MLKAVESCNLPMAPLHPRPRWVITQPAVARCGAQSSDQLLDQLEELPLVSCWWLSAAADVRCSVSRTRCLRANAPLRLAANNSSSMNRRRNAISAAVFRQ